MSLDPTTGRCVTYNSQNELISSTLGGVSLTYDPLGRLYQVSSPSGVRRFQYASDDSGTPEVISEYNGSNQGTESYGYGPGPDEPMLWSSGASGFALRNPFIDGRGIANARFNLKSGHKSVGKRSGVAQYRQAESKGTQGGTYASRFDACAFGICRRFYISDFISGIRTG